MVWNETSYFDTKPDELTDVALRRMKSVYDYRCVVCGESKPNPLMSDNKFFFLGLGRKHVYQWTGDTKEQWKKPVQETLELPADTLFYGEVVQEFEGEGRHQKRFNTVHIIDALVLGKVDVRDMHYDERMKWVRKFVKAVSKPSRNDLMPLRAKEVFKLEDKNFGGLSNAVEVVTAGVIFSRSLKLHKLQYVTMLSNGDSKAFTHVAVRGLYDKDIQREDCVNHVAKRMCSGMEKLKKSKKGLGREGEVD
ncbi:hypothetical protein IscW_ISCW017275 [Ixodes scapularis]|uniref:Cap-specific mRNA (nucleoside-2'-O-)-methyltransferase 1 n=1 Tax=Ixodes scapularis TaxID=6945 RepID=B7P8D1_IXOSC|nr:hypothetical protein IscW_ISCW017275 [Ixodes scapularis]|eukprot:XP_002401830.1 hypothetical protein IscW_ISCW017275 [Ixodes scapularis]